MHFLDYTTRNYNPTKFNFVLGETIPLTTENPDPV